jgi:hypothetical protein
VEQPTMVGAQAVAADVTSLTSYLPVPGLGVLPVNAFVLHARQPLLVDTGIAALRDPWVQALQSVVDPADLRWIWLTHADPDHLGNLEPLLRIAPQARVVTSFLGAGKLGLLRLPTDRVHLVEVGDTLDLGDRRLTALRPPTYDAPETLACFDARSRTLFSSDCFGGLLERPVPAAAELSAKALGDGIAVWSAIDAPWLSLTDDRRFGAALHAVRALQPELVLSSHLPPAHGLTETLLGCLAAARGAAAPVQSADDRARSMQTSEALAA